MKRGKLFLSALAFFLAIGSAWAVKSHRAFSLGNVYTFNGSTFVRIPCQTPNGSGTCVISGTKYTYSTTPQGQPTYISVPENQVHPTADGQ